MPVDLVTYLNALGGERHRALILHAAPQQAVALSAFAERAAQRMGGAYLDLLAHFRDRRALAETLDAWGPRELLQLVTERAAGQRLLVVDRADFLLDTWRKPEREALYRIVSAQWDGFTPAMRAILVLCLQSRSELARLTITDPGGASRVRPLEDFYALT